MNETLLKAGAAAFGVVGLAFGYVALSVAIDGTGESIPSGANIIEGELLPGATRRGPVGEPFLFGDVRINDPEASSAIEQTWSTPIGENRVRLRKADGEETFVELPPAMTWKGIVPHDEEEVQSLEDLPVVGEIEDVGERMAPPYLLVVEAVRAGDHIVAMTDDGGDVIQLWVGSREELEAQIARHEAMRWPIVGIMGMMALVSFFLGFRALRRKES